MARPENGIAVRGGGGERDGDGADEQRRHGGPLDPQHRGADDHEDEDDRARKGRIPEALHVFAHLGRNRAVPEGRRGRGARRPGEQHGQERAQGGPAAAPQREPRQPGAEARERQDGRLREPDCGRAGEGRAEQPQGRGRPVGEMDGHERERDRRGGVGRVLLDLGAVRDHRRAEGKEGGREDGGPARKDAAREQREQPERREAAEQGDEAQGELARTEERDASLDERQESGRGDLVERERLAEQGSERSVDHVLRDGDLVDPQGRPREVLPQAQGGAGEDEQRDRGPLPGQLHAGMLADRT